MPDAAGLSEALRPELLKVFKPAFLGRVTVVPYFPLSPEIIHEIVAINLQKLKDRVAANYAATLAWTPDLIDAIAARCTETQSGARNIESIINQTIVPTLANKMLSAMAEGHTTKTIGVSVGAGGELSYEFS